MTNNHKHFLKTFINSSILFTIAEYSVFFLIKSNGIAIFIAHVFGVIFLAVTLSSLFEMGIKEREEEWKSKNNHSNN